MSTSFKETLAAAGAVIDNDGIASFGDAAGELAAARDALAGAPAVLCPLAHLGSIRVGGEEAGDFLHNQFTSDIRHLAPGALQHSAWCSAKGRMLASFLVWREGGAAGSGEAGDYLLALSADLAEPVTKRLQMFVLRAKVSITRGGDPLLFGLAGEEAAAALAAVDLPVPAAMQRQAAGALSVLRLDDARFVIALPAAAAGDLWRQLAARARPVGTPVWRWLDVRAGLPLVGAATREQFVPQMANFERIGGVSFHKGCYPGQEIVARTQYLGKVKRHLFRLRGDAAMAAGAELFSEAVADQACGMVVSGAPSPEGGYEALAVLMEAAVDATIHVGTRDGARATAAAVAA